MDVGRNPPAGVLQPGPSNAYGAQAAPAHQGLPQEQPPMQQQPQQQYAPMPPMHPPVSQNQSPLMVPRKTAEKNALKGWIERWKMNRVVPPATVARHSAGKVSLYCINLEDLKDLSTNLFPPDHKVSLWCNLLFYDSKEHNFYGRSVNTTSVELEPSQFSGRDRVPSLLLHECLFFQTSITEQGCKVLLELVARFTPLQGRAQPQGMSSGYSQQQSSERRHSEPVSVGWSLLDFVGSPLGPRGLQSRSFPLVAGTPRLLGVASGTNAIQAMEAIDRVATLSASVGTFDEGWLRSADPSGGAALEGRVRDICRLLPEDAIYVLGARLGGLHFGRAFTESLQRSRGLGFSEGLLALLRSTEQCPNVDLALENVEVVFSTDGWFDFFRQSMAELQERMASGSGEGGKVEVVGMRVELGVHNGLKFLTAGMSGPDSIGIGVPLKLGGKDLQDQEQREGETGRELVYRGETARVVLPQFPVDKDAAAIVAEMFAKVAFVLPPASRPASPSKGRKSPSPQQKQALAVRREELDVCVGWDFLLPLSSTFPLNAEHSRQVEMAAAQGFTDDSVSIRTSRSLFHGPGTSLSFKNVWIPPPTSKPLTLRYGIGGPILRHIERESFVPASPKRSVMSPTGMPPAMGMPPPLSLPAAAAQRDPTKAPSGQPPGAPLTSQQPSGPQVLPMKGTQNPFTPLPFPASPSLPQQAPKQVSSPPPLMASAGVSGAPNQVPALASPVPQTMPQGPNPLEASINMFYGTRANQMPPPNPSFPHPNQRTMTAGGITPAAMANDMQQQHFQLLAGNAAHAAPPNSAVYAMSMMAPSSPPRRPLPENSLLAHPAYLHVQGTAREPTGHPALVGGSAIGSPPPVLPNTDARLKHPDHPAFAGSRPRSPVKPHGGALDSPRRANSRERDRDGGDWGGDPEEDPWEDRPMKPLFLQRRLVNRRELAGLIGQSPDIFSYLYGGDVKGPGATGAIPGDAGRRGSVFAETGGALGGAGLPREGEDLIPSVPSAGYYPLLDRDFEKRGGPVDWSLEASDPLQADQLVFHFLKFKPVSRAVFSVLPPGASASGAGVGASARPFDFSARVHFVLRFFIFPPLCTSPAVVRHTPPLHSTGLQSRPDDPSENGDGSVLKGADGRGLLLRYLVAPRRPPRRRGATDPYRMAERGEVDERRLDRYRHQVAAGPERVSVTGEREGGEDEADFAPAPPSHLELCQYLHGRCAEVEVWHTDGCIQLGSAFIPLSGLIRQQRPVVKEVFDYPVTDALTGELQGFITVLAGNVGKRPVHAHSDAPPGSVLAEVERQEEEEERERDRQRVHTAAGGVFTKQIPGVSAGRKGGRPARFKGTRLRTRVDDEADEIEAKMNEEKSNLMRAEEEMEGKRESEAPEYPKPLSDPSSSMKEMRLRIMKEKARRGLIFRFDPREDQLNRLSVVSPQKGRGRSPSPRRGGGGGGGGGGTFDDPEKDRAARRRAQMEKVQEQREMMQREIRLAKAQKLSLVAEAREARFPLYVRALLDEFMREKLVVHPTLGVPLYFTIEFHNPFDQDTHFLLQIRHACEPPTDSGAFSALSDSPKMKPKSPTSIALEKDPPPTHPLPLVVPVASSRNRGRQLLDSLGGPVEPLVQPELTVCEDPNEWYEGVSRQAAFVQNMGGPMRLEDRRQVEEDMLGFGKVPRDRGNADCHACDDRKHSYAFGEPRPTFGLLSKSKRTAVAPQPPHRQQHWQFILKPFEKVFVPFRYFSVQTEAPMQYMVSGKEMKQIAAQEAALEREAEKDGRDRKGPSKALEGPSPPTGVRRAAMSSLEVMRVWSRMERDFRRRVVLSFATSNGQVMRETDVQVSPRPFVLDGSYRFFAEEDTTLLQEVTAAVPLPLPARGDRLRAQKVKEELRIVREEMAREGEGSDEYDAFQRWREMNAYGEGSREGFSSSAVGGGGSSSLLLGSHMICTDSNVSLEATESACPLSLFSDFDEDGRGLLNGGDGGFAEELPPDAEGGRLDAAEEAEWRTLNGKQKYTAVRIRIRCHVTSSRKRTFLILFYHHSAPRRLAATFLFSVQPVRRESTALPVGNKLEKHVAIPSSIFKRFGGLPRPVRFFTTDSWLAVVSDPPLGEAAKVSPLASTEFRLTVTPYRQGLSRCRVHALDALTGELLNAWILSVDALPPAVRDCHTIYAQRGRISRHTVPFRSPLSYDATIHLSTSDPLILQASSPFRIAGNGQCDMELFVCLDEYTLNLSQQLFAVNALEARRQREVGRGPFGTGVRTNGQEDSSFGGPPWVGWHPGGLGRGPASVEVYLFLRSRDGELQETDKVKIFIRQ